MTRRAALALFFIPMALIAPLFMLGGILNWPDEAFAWVGLGASAVGMSIAYLLFYEEPDPSEADKTGTSPTIAELMTRIEALDEQLRQDLAERRAEREARATPRPSGS